MMMEATELGLGSVWVCYFQSEVIKKEFCLPDNMEPINILVIGYSAEPPIDPERHSQMRIPMEKLVSYENVDYQRATVKSCRPFAVQKSISANCVCIFWSSKGGPGLSTDEIKNMERS